MRKEKRGGKKGRDRERDRRRSSRPSEEQPNHWEEGRVHIKEDKKKGPTAGDVSNKKKLLKKVEERLVRKLQRQETDNKK